ncbi:MAG TPA: hypothetical protein VMU29_08575 [Smithella sp.]|nr:hypothetical protein [Smithella sp.]
MTTIWSNKRLREFVQETLGCMCPEKVFEKINISSRLVEGYSNEITRIVVGNTLLIYVIRPESDNNLFDSVELIGLVGKNDRDLNNYNRFRLVVSIVEDFAHNDTISERFSSIFATDEKMHIHFVRKELLEGL